VSRGRPWSDTQTVERSARINVDLAVIHMEPMRQLAHESYLEQSPAYSELFDLFGSTIPEVSAERVAGMHGTSLALLVEQGELPSAVYVNTLDLIQALGY
jgi:hypothetical protein